MERILNGGVEVFKIERFVEEGSDADAGVKRALPQVDRVHTGDDNYRF